MFNSAAQGGDIAVDTRIVEVVALVDAGSGALLGAVERGFDLAKLVEGQGEFFALGERGGKNTSHRAKNYGKYEKWMTRFHGEAPADSLLRQDKRGFVDKSSMNYLLGM